MDEFPRLTQRESQVLKVAIMLGLWFGLSLSWSLLFQRISLHLQVNSAPSMIQREA